MRVVQRRSVCAGVPVRRGRGVAAGRGARRRQRRRADVTGARRATEQEGAPRRYVLTALLRIIC